jgi:hypothetical protein
MANSPRGIDTGTAAGVRHGEGLLKFTLLATRPRSSTPHGEYRCLRATSRGWSTVGAGPYTINAYFNAAGANDRSFTPDGFYRTGDRVRRFANGYSR